MQTLIANAILVVLNTSIFHGRKKLRKEDLAANGVDVDLLPPGTLATLGSKRIISPKTIAIFIALKAEADRLCLQHGVRFMGGYAIPNDKSAELISALSEVKTKFEDARVNFLNVYDAEVENWIATNPPEWAAVIRAAVEPISHLRRNISFNFAAMTMGAPENIPVNGLEEEISGLFGQLCHEIRVAARQAYETSFIGKLEVTRKALRPLKSIREKLAGLAFLDPSIADTLLIIDATLDKIPKTGAIKGCELNMVAGLLGRQLANLGRVVPPEAPHEVSSEDDDEYEEEIVYVDEDDTSEEVHEITTLNWDF